MCLHVPRQLVGALLCPPRRRQPLARRRERWRLHLRRRLLRLAVHRKLVLVTAHLATTAHGEAALAPSTLEAERVVGARLGGTAQLRRLGGDSAVVQHPKLASEAAVLRLHQPAVSW